MTISCVGPVARYTQLKGTFSFHAELLELEPGVWNHVIAQALLHSNIPGHGK